MKSARLPMFYGCPVCEYCHPIGWNGDCRDDANRFTADQLDDKYGRHGWDLLGSLYAKENMK